jgi:mRNA turnover protein 4
MPRSKRARVVHESKTAKKDHKEQTRRLYANIRECLEEYDHMFVFAVDNMRNTYLKDVRTEFADSRYVNRSYSNTGSKLTQMQCLLR